MTSKKELQCSLLHCHSGYSTYDGMGLPKDRAKRAKDLGMTHLAMTDHGTMSGIVDHYLQCNDIGITPILGIEAYHQPVYTPGKFLIDDQGKRQKIKRYHLTLLAKNLDGYYSLAQMSSDAYTQYYTNGFPISDFSLLEKYSNGVICLSGCVLGCLCQTILNDTFDQAQRYTERFLEIYGDNFFFEVQPQEFEAQKIANEGILKLADIFKRPVVMTSDSHYVNPDDIDSYVLLRQMNYHMPKQLTTEQIAKKEERELKKKEREEKKKEQLALKGLTLDHEDETSQEELEEKETEIESDDMFKSDLDKFNSWADGIRSQYQRLYMPSGRELADRWEQFMGSSGEEYVENSQMVANLCSVELKFPELVPKAIVEVDPVTQEPIESKKILARKVRKGLEQMGLWDKIEAREVIDEDGVKQIETFYPYKERAKYEFKRITNKSMEDYFLLVADLVEEARRRGIAVGPGRGSGGASLVARAIGITEIDPVATDCMFDRFLPDYRKNLPDFDVDFGPTYRRDELKQYMIEKYNGKAAVICNIIRLTRDVLINDLAKILNIPTDVADALKKLVASMGIGDKDKTVYPVYSELMQNKDIAKIDFLYQHVVLHFCKLYGSMRGYSKHASGLAISSGNLSQYTPLFVRGKEVYTAYEKKMLEKLNIVKIDILGIDAIAAVQQMCKLTNVDHLDIPMNDKEVYQMFADLDTVGIFQFDTPSAKQYLDAVKPENLDELSACTALNRPGSSNMGSTQVYVDGKKGKIDMTTPLAQCCKDSYGALIYQEHVLLACRNIGHMSWENAVRVMKTLHGQNHREDPLPQEFITGCVKYSGLTEDEAWELYNRITSYTFNKAHAIAYSTLAYWMMWFKKYHPFEYYLSILQFENDENRRRTYEADAYNRKEKKDKVVVLLPHVNGSRNYHAVTIGGHRFIRAGLQGIDKVGPAAAIAIEKEWKANGDFTNVEDLLKRVNGTYTVLKGRGKEKVEVEMIRKSPVKTDTLQALIEAGAVEFDFDKYKKRCTNYLGSLVNKKKRKWA